ncbi:8819_t:CDS:2 [Cetraspora pellucida]|uniref:8819_t:CDS:1 n=1 Tax=Cetraspora pellucida TaxID=1433469 RepID=A0A9N8YS55_9GLOM|nr:8819_t:CDS:2 [Cetraspora pellucida]
MSLDLVVLGLELSFRQFIENLIVNIPEFDDFDDFLSPSNNLNINRIKGKIFEYFIYKILIKNRIIVCINTTFISFSKKKYFTLLDDCVDIHGRYELLNFSIQCKFKNPNYKIPVSEIREFLNMANRRIDDSQHIGFFVSNVGLGDNAENELNSSSLKDKICICLYYEIVNKIKEYAKLLKIDQEELKKSDQDRKRKFIELKQENEILRMENKKIKQEKYEVYEKSIEELEKKIEEQNKKINIKLENQSQEFNKKLDMILNKLN